MPRRRPGNQRNEAPHLHEGQGKKIPSEPGCGICGGPAYFDLIRDINLCDHCGAQETSKGWQARPNPPIRKPR